MTHTKTSRFLKSLGDLGTFAAENNSDFLLVVDEDGTRARLGICRLRTDRVLKVEWHLYDDRMYTKAEQHGFVEAVIIEPSEMVPGITASIFDFLQGDSIITPRSHNTGSRFLTSLDDLNAFDVVPSTDYLLVVYRDGAAVKLGKCISIGLNSLEVEWTKSKPAIFAKSLSLGFVLALIVDPDDIAYGLAPAAFEYLQHISNLRAQT